jgi:hypothetical protein
MIQVLMNWEGQIFLFSIDVFVVLFVINGSVGTVELGFFINNYNKFIQFINFNDLVGTTLLVLNWVMLFYYDESSSSFKCSS